MTLKYRYTGTDEKHLPQHKITVHPKDIVTVTIPINHPDFEFLKEQEAKGNKK